MVAITLRSASVLRFTDNSGQLADNGEGLDYLFGFGFGFNEADRTVAVGATILAVLVRPPESTEEEGPTLQDEPTSGDAPIAEDAPAAEVEVECVFELGSLDEFRTEAGEVKLSRRLLAHLAGITASTARGVFIGAGRSLLLQRAPLPIGAPIRIIDQFLDGGDYPWVNPIPAMPPPEEA